MNTRFPPQLFQTQEEMRRFHAEALVMDKLMREEQCGEFESSDAAFSSLMKQFNEEVELIMNPRPDESNVEIREEDTICPICNEVYFNPYRLAMCKHIFCLPCLLERFDKGNPSTTFLEECPVCSKTILSVPRPEERLNAFTAQLRTKQGMPSPLMDTLSSNPFDKYTI